MCLVILMPILSLWQIPKVFFSTFLEIVVVSWILLSYFELTMGNVKLIPWCQFLLISYSVLIVIIINKNTNIVIIFATYCYYYCYYYFYYYYFYYQYFYVDNCITMVIYEEIFKCLLREKCPNIKFFLVSIFLY